MKQTLNMNDSQETVSVLKTPLSNEITQFIGVTPPYFSLTNLSIDEKGYLYAEVPNTCKDSAEHGSITLSEVGRHMGVLGSLAMANMNPVKEKHYYLIKEVCFDTLKTNTIEGEKYQLRAKVNQISKKGGSIHVQLFADEELQYSSDIEYIILHHRIFARRFRATYLSKDKIYGKYIENDYSQSTSIYFHKKTIESFTAYLNYIDPSDCPGHFENYPIMPVSRICEAISDVTGKHYESLHSNDRCYSFKHVELKAYSFIPAGENAKIVTKVIADTVDSTVIEARIFKNKDFKCLAVEIKIWFSKTAH